jgi:protease-4
MSFTADRLLDRIRLKVQVNRWRSFAVFILVLFALSLLSNNVKLMKISKDHIARVDITGIILEDRFRDQRLEELKSDKNAKAVIVYINSPGGTIVGGETLYNSLREISQVKPVVAVMGSVAASGGYMTAIAADRIFARSGTITGSIGVMMQTAEFTDMADKLGIKFLTFKSGDMKGLPSPMEKLDQKTAAIIDAGVADGFDFFINLVKERRKLTEENLKKISDGRIFTGRQALEQNLVDELGGEDEAVTWLVSNKKIVPNLKIKDIQIQNKDDLFSRMYAKVISSNNSYVSKIMGEGIVAIWNPSM